MRCTWSWPNSRACRGRTLSGTIQNDILKEFIAQKEYIYPPRPSMRLVTDMFAFCAREVPRWNTISVSGYHIREAGATAAQELAFTLRDGIEYVQYGIDAGLDVDEFAPRISFFFNAHSDFFEEIAKYRAARAIWADVMRDRFGAQSERSWKLRFHSQTAGVSLTAQQPYNNVVRTALQALSAVLGGTNSLHTNSLDEALALPTEEAATLALRTQQIIAHETGVAERRRSARRVVLRRGADRGPEARGATTTSTASTRWAAWSRPSSRAFRSARSPRAPTGSSRPSSSKEQVIVGVNDFVAADEPPVEILYIDDAATERQMARLAEVKAARDEAAVARALGVDAARRGRHREPDAADPRRRARVRDPRRDVRRAPGRLGRVGGRRGHLNCGSADARSRHSWRSSTIVSSSCVDWQ